MGNAPETPPERSHRETDLPEDVEHPNRSGPNARTLAIVLLVIVALGIAMAVGITLQ